MTVYIDIISGFLGAGKTTFLKKIIPSMKGKVALIENEFGEVGVDGDLLHGDLPMKEIYAGCICCSLVPDLKRAIEGLALEFAPDHILIEPSGVGNLSDIIKVCTKISEKSEFDIKLNHLITMVDVSAFEEYIDNFGEFYLDQIQNAHMIFLSHFDKVNSKTAEKVISKIRCSNPEAFILEEAWCSLTGERIIEIMDTMNIFKNALAEKPTSLPANKLFRTFSFSHPKRCTKKELDHLFVSLKKRAFGYILRAKGFLQLDTKEYIYFDFTPQHIHWEYIESCKETKIVVIGCNLRKEQIVTWFSTRMEG